MPVGNRLPRYSGMADRRRSSRVRSGATGLSTAKKHNQMNLELAEALPSPRATPSRATPRSVRKIVTAEGSPRGRRSAAKGAPLVTIRGTPTTVKTLTPALVPRPPASEPLAPTPRSSPSASANRRLLGSGELPQGMMASRDFVDEVSPAVQWGSVRGTTNVLSRGDKASDRELTQALAQITKTLSQQVAGGVGMSPASTCWIGGIPEECADQQTLTAAFEGPCGLGPPVRSIAVRTKPGDAKCWALVVFKTAAGNVHTMQSPPTVIWT